MPRLLARAPQVVPSLAAQYVRDFVPLGPQLKIRRFLTGGEALSAQLSNSVYEVRGLPRAWLRVWGPWGLGAGLWDAGARGAASCPARCAR